MFSLKFLIENLSLSGSTASARAKVQLNPVSVTYYQSERMLKDWTFVKVLFFMELFLAKNTRIGLLCADGLEVEDGCQPWFISKMD